MGYRAFYVLSVFTLLLYTVAAGPGTVGVCYTACNAGYVSW